MWQLLRDYGKFILDPRSPSWCKSTLAQMAMASVSCYLVIAMKVAWVTGDLSGLWRAAEVFGASYLTARKMNGGGNPPVGGANA